MCRMKEAHREYKNTDVSVKQRVVTSIDTHTNSPNERSFSQKEVLQARSRGAKRPYRMIIYGAIER